MLDQRLRSRLRSVDDRNALKTARDHCMNDPASRAPSADDNGESLPLIPAGRSLVQVGQESGNVGIVAPQATVFSP
jgi:hypothetical protein